MAMISIIYVPTCDSNCADRNHWDFSSFSKYRFRSFSKNIDRQGGNMLKGQGGPVKFSMKFLEFSPNFSSNFPGHPQAEAPALQACRLSLPCCRPRASRGRFTALARLAYLARSRSLSRLSGQRRRRRLRPVRSTTAYLRVFAPREKAYLLHLFIGEAPLLPTHPYAYAPLLHEQVASACSASARPARLCIQFMPAHRRLLVWCLLAAA